MAQQSTSTRRRRPSLVRRPKQQRAHATVDALMEATARILEEGGLTALTTNAVAQRAGVSIGSLYEYFDSKEALLRAWCERYITSVRALVDELFDAMGSFPHTDAVAEFIDATFALNLDRPKLRRVVLEELPALLGHHPIRDIDDYIVERWAALLRLQRSALPEDLELRLYALVRMGRAVTGSWTLEGRPLEALPGLKRALVAVILAALEPTPRD